MVLFILFYKKCHPKDMGEKEISLYLSYLATDRKVVLSGETGVKP